jgi:drug/metabolite transporter (DMT)-like permease
MSRRAVVLFVAASFAWALPFYCVGVLADEVSPTAITFWRCLVATAVLAPFARRVPRASGLLRRRSPGLALFAITQTVIPFYLIAHAQEAASSSFASVMIASWPLIGICFAMRLIPGTVVARPDVIGILMGLVGVVALVGLDAGSVSYEAALDLVIAAACYASGPTILNRYLPDVDSAISVSVATAAAVVVYSPFAWVGVQQLASPKLIANIVALGAISTALAIFAFNELIIAAGPIRASVAAYTSTGLAVLVGVVIGNDALTPGIIVGLALILGGSLISTLARRRDASVPPIIEVLEPGPGGHA